MIPVLILPFLMQHHKTAEVNKPVAVHRHHAQVPGDHPKVPDKPYHMWDATTPGNLPAGKPAAVYSNGAFAATHSQVRGHTVLWIDVTGGNPDANVLDVEKGDAPSGSAAGWVQARTDRHPNSTAIIYSSVSSWKGVKENVSHLPDHVKSHVRYWIAQPTGKDHLVPGSDATQWNWSQGTDESTATQHLTKP